MAEDKSSSHSTRAYAGPSPAQILEFARKSKLVNFDVSVGTLLEHLSIVDPSKTGPGAVADGGWGIISRGFAIVTSSESPALEELSSGPQV